MKSRMRIRFENDGASLRPGVRQRLPHGTRLVGGLILVAGAVLLLAGLGEALAWMG